MRIVDANILLYAVNTAADDCSTTLTTDT